MPNVTIVTDSSSDLPIEVAERLGITVVPLSIRFGDDELVDRVELTPADFWARCATTDKLPETAAPSPGAFQAAYEAARQAGASGVLCLTISSALSGTYQSALTAASATEGFPVEVVDSRAVTMVLGLLAIAAAEAAQGGASLEELVASTRSEMSRMGVIGCLDTLEHLKKGGRVGGAQALLGSMLSIKPLLELKDGVVAPAGKQRTRAKAIAHVAEVVSAGGPYERLAVVHGNAPDMDALLGMLEGVSADHPIITGDIGPVVGTHGGPGIIGVCWISRA